MNDGRGVKTARRLQGAIYRRLTGSCISEFWSIGKRCPLSPSLEKKEGVLLRIQLTPKARKIKPSFEPVSNLVWGTRTVLDLGGVSRGSVSSCRGVVFRSDFSPLGWGEGDAMTGGGGPIDRDGGDDRGERSVWAFDLSLPGEELPRAGLSLFLRINSAIGLLLNLSREEGRGESWRGDRSLRGERPRRPSRWGVSLKAQADLAPSAPPSSTNRVLLYSFLSMTDVRNNLFASQASAIGLANVLRREAIARAKVPWGMGGGGGRWWSCPGGLILRFRLASINQSRVNEFQRVSPSITTLKNAKNSSVGRVRAIRVRKKWVNEQWVNMLMP